VDESVLDPSQFTPLPPPIPENSLLLLDDHELEQTLLMARLVCGRNATVFKRKNRKYVCALFRILDAERARRHPLEL